MTAPFSASTTQVAGLTPVQVATWQRGDSDFSILLRVDPGGPATIYITRIANGTYAEAFPVMPGDVIGMDVPAKASAYAPTPPAEFMYAFTDDGRSAKVSVLIEPR